MKTLIAGDLHASRGSAWIAAIVAIAVVAVFGAASSNKVSFYLDALERSRLLYAIPIVAAAGLIIVLAYPRLSLLVMAFLLPFNFVGGLWGTHIVVLVAKMGVNLMAVAALATVFLAPAADRAWITGTRLGVAVLGWLAAVVMGVAIGLLSAESREYWMRESGWMLFFAAALPFGTLISSRRDIRRLLWAACAGVALLQVYAFWALMTAGRYARADAWTAGSTFFRAPYSCVSLFVLYLAAAALLFKSSEKMLTRGTGLFLFAAVALLGGGLLASMVRSLWISGTIGMAVVLFVVPWDRRTAKAAVAVATGAVLAVGVVAVIDRLSPGSSGNWTASAISFFLDLGSKDSTSRVTRAMEWGHAWDVWQRSPFVGMGFGYAFPQVTFGKAAGEVVLETFYIHNSYMNILAKTGAFGLAAFLYLLWCALQSARALIRSPGATLNDRILATALLAGGTSVAVLTTTMPVLTAGDPAAYLGMLIGLTVAVSRLRLAEAP